MNNSGPTNLEQTMKSRTSPLMGEDTEVLIP
jgi:hypothetical protein